MQQSFFNDTIVIKALKKGLKKAQKCLQILNMAPSSMVKKKNGS
jgi:hypothetical protein